MTTAYEVGISYLQAALAKAEIELIHIQYDWADKQFPNTYDALSQYDVAILSDIRSNTLLIHPDTSHKGLQLLFVQSDGFIPLLFSIDR